MGGARKSEKQKQAYHQVREAAHDMSSKGPGSPEAVVIMEMALKDQKLIENQF